jgi:hypothetical protein
VKKKAIRRKLNTILAKLETMQIEIEATLANIDMDALGIDDDPEEYNADLRTYIINDDGTRRECAE